MFELNDISSSHDFGKWRESRTGNYVYICYEKIAATVFNPPKAEAGVWCIIINRALGGYIVEDEYFTDVDDARERAEEILDGASAKLKLMRSRDE